MVLSPYCSGLRCCSWLQGWNNFCRGTDALTKEANPSSPGVSTELQHYNKPQKSSLQAGVGQEDELD